MAILYIPLSHHFFLSYSFSSAEKHDYVFKQKPTIFPHLSEIYRMMWPLVFSPRWERLYLKTVFVTKPVSDTVTKPPRTSLSARAWECRRTLRPHTISDYKQSAPLMTTSTLHPSFITGNYRNAAPGTGFEVKLQKAMFIVVVVLETTSSLRFLCS